MVYNKEASIASRDMKGKVPVRLLYIIPVRLSAKAAKQKIYVSDDVLSSSIMLALVAGKGWMLEIKLLVYWSSQKAGYVGVGAATGSMASLRCVLQIPICRRFMCPLAVARLGLRNFVMPVAGI